MNDSQFCKWLRETERRLSDLDKRLLRWMQMPIDINKLDEEMARLTKERRESCEYQKMLDDLHRVVEDVCRRYLETDSEERAQIRELASAHENVLHSLTACIDHATERLGVTRDAEWLRIGLATASIENVSIDTRDTILALEKLYHKAEELDIDPKTFFEEIGALSSDQPAPGALAAASMRELLVRFHEQM